MSLAYILDGGMNDEPGTGAEMYAKYPAARKIYDDIRNWTGLTHEQVIHEQRPDGQSYRHGIGTIRQAAAIVGISDVLAEHGVMPALAGGPSFGALVAACLAGAIDRADLFTLLCRMREVPPSPDPTPQGIAVLYIPADAEPADHLRALSTDVHLGADCGVIGPDVRMILVGGYRHALAELAGRVPEKAFLAVDAYSDALHTPLQQHLSDHIEPFVAKIAFHDARIPVISCMEPGTVTDAADFADVFVRNPVTTARIPYLLHGLAAGGVTLGLILGPAHEGIYERPPIPLVHVAAPEHITEALTAIHDLDVPL
jgi:[acyl-carrier-protein] S-malonyltransferase